MAEFPIKIRRKGADGKVTIVDSAVYFVEPLDASGRPGKFWMKIVSSMPAPRIGEEVEIGENIFRVVDQHSDGPPKGPGPEFTIEQA